MYHLIARQTRKSLQKCVVIYRLAGGRERGRRGRQVVGRKGGGRVGCGGRREGDGGDGDGGCGKERPPVYPGPRDDCGALTVSSGHRTWQEDEVSTLLLPSLPLAEQSQWVDTSPSRS